MRSVDIAQQTAEGPQDDTAERIAKDLKRRSPYLAFWDGAEKEKRFVDLLRDSLSGYDTTPEEDARVRQGELEREFEDEHEFLDTPRKWNEMRKKL